ncbi:MAG: hypothetical protein NW218_22340 [Saprospiraceae bacterium]|nr:hypothetical protein [Saprospiraceae bacterium]
MSEISYTLGSGEGSFGRAVQVGGQHVQQIKSTALLSAFFGRDYLANLLAQPGSMGLRIYPAFDRAGQFSLLAIATDSGGSDMTSNCYIAEGQGGASHMTGQQAGGMLSEVNRAMTQAAREGRGNSMPLFAAAGSEGTSYAKADFKSADINGILNSGAEGIRFFSTRIILTAGDQSFSTVAAVGVDGSGNESGAALISTLPCPPHCAGGGYINDLSRNS